MKVLKRLGIPLIITMAFVGGLEVAHQKGVSGVYSLISASEARVGRPLTPVSVAGVSRRTSRRN